MGKIFRFLFFLSIFLVAAYSLPANDTRSTTAKKRSFSLGSVANVFTGRQTSVAITDSIYKVLKNVIYSYGTVTISVWNRSPVAEFKNAKWFAKNAEIDSPLKRTIRNQEGPASIVAHYSKNFLKKCQKNSVDLV